MGRGLDNEVIWADSAAWPSYFILELEPNLSKCMWEPRLSEGRDASKHGGSTYVSSTCVLAKVDSMRA